ncbi:sigma-70 family RNA polymerase sigma factor [Kineosporia rhizophila]|uniref:RNA polymerase sigma factor n=1 Tax=Kineosporia TaxID=49184 RepID=UPI001E48FF5C|nr:sigma-70 family RNA polymerase sigma factor [Kineosporia sp. NBRC 101677]MCE0538097.1 sigma-70 family RNA polymerase sigma factor [Kineosporia rhizophila]
MRDPAADDAFRRLYTANFPAILNYAQRRVGGPDDAADLVAETFLVAWRRREELPPGPQARLWLFGVARLVLANHTRGEQRRVQLGARLRLELRDEPGDPAADLVEVMAVDSALAALDDTDREVLELTVWDQLTPREIGALLDLPARVVRSRLFRARARMRGRTDLSAVNVAAEKNDRAGPGHVTGVHRTLASRRDPKA